MFNILELLQINKQTDIQIKECPQKHNRWYIQVTTQMLWTCQHFYRLVEEKVGVQSIPLVLFYHRVSLFIWFCLKPYKERYKNNGIYGITGPRVLQTVSLLYKLNPKRGITAVIEEDLGRCFSLFLLYY